MARKDFDFDFAAAGVSKLHSRKRKVVIVADVAVVVGKKN